MTLRVLLIDDNRGFLNAATRLLEAEGVTVAGTASSAAEARQLADSTSADAALVDIKLGADSGIDLAARLLSENRPHRLPVILISTHAEEDLRDLIDASPALGFIAKSELSLAAVLRTLNPSPG
jgi:DNA-binding NarL/FixJ family response regulator